MEQWRFAPQTPGTAPRAGTIPVLQLFLFKRASFGTISKKHYGSFPEKTFFIVDVIRSYREDIVKRTTDFALLRVSVTPW